VCLRDGSVRVAAGEQMLDVPARGTVRVEAAACLGQFFDFTHAYRFGPPSHDVTIATLTDAASGEVLAEAFHLPDRSPVPRYDPGLTVTPMQGPDGWQLVIETQRFARFVHVTDAHYRAACDWFHLAPGSRRVVDLIPLPARTSIGATSPTPLCTKDTATAPAGEVRAINAPAPVFYG
jgi:beta-mannosidase